MKMKKIRKGNLLRRLLTVPVAAVLAVCLIAAAAAGIVLAANGSDDSGPAAVQADADALAKTLVSEGITYEDAVILKEGKGFQYATFTGLPEDYYDFSDGIILSSGNAAKAFTSCPSGGAGTEHTQYENASDIAGKAYYRLYETYDSYCKTAGVSSNYLRDAAVFAIKVTPTTSALSFRYFFASNEYNQSPQYNDTFALWVVQDFGGADEKWNNIAKIPADRMPDGAVSNEVNIQNTCPNPRVNQKYKNSIPGIYKYNANENIGYLGCTEALDAEIDTLVPGKPVWVVMAVGDAGDMGMDSAVFIKAKSIKFAKASEATITYDADGGAFSDSETKAVRNVASGSSYTIGEGIDAPARTGYVFDGWYTAAGDGQKAQGSATAQSDTTYYAHWKPLTGKVTVSVKKDGGAVPAGTTVELWQNGATAYTLTQNGTSWAADNIRNGEYQVFVDGKDAESSVTVNAMSQGDMFSASEINYYTVTADVTLDGKAWSGQTVTLSDGTPLTGNGPYTTVLREKPSGNGYTVQVRGEDVGTVTATASGTKSITAAYHTIQVTVNDTMAWTDASVTLRRNGADVHRLTYNSSTNKYEIILPATDTAAYSVFIDGRDVGKTVSTTSKTAAVTFYTASVKITGGFAGMPVAITNGTDSYILSGGNTTGTAYTCRRVLDRGSTGYTITVGGTVGTVADKVTSAATVNLTYHTVTFKNASGGTYVTQYVLSGTQAQNVPVPIKEGSVSLGWGLTSGASQADFSFNTAVTSAKTLYPVYEAAGIKLGEHIQTGNTTAYTYQLPNLTIRGYASVSTVVLTVTNCSDVTVGSGITKKTALDTDGNGTIILTFSSGTTGAVAQTKLRSMTVKVKNAAKNHTIQAVVYGGQY
ncbi:MAG: InlB B-repeat-containing protein [Ruminococcus flavefaciens]|nr:InlB B-repeat-containing protein [Ruminococcus flavefaciens]